MPVRVANIGGHVESGWDNRAGGPSWRTAKIANLTDVTEHSGSAAYPDSHDQFRERAILQQSEVYTVPEMAEQIRNLRAEFNSADIKWNRDAVVTANQWYDSARSECTEFTRKEIKRVSDSLSEITAAEVKTLVGDAIEKTVVALFAKCVGEFKGEIEGLKAKIEALENRNRPQT